MPQRHRAFAASAAPVMPQQYVSTSKAARILNLSLGTVQRMVDRGMLESFTTEGRHRRILFRSLADYCRDHGIEIDPQWRSPLQGVCVIHSAEHPLRGRRQLEKVPGVHFCSNPLDLLFANRSPELLFLDARLGWMDWMRLAQSVHVQQGSRLVIYNAEHLSAEVQQALAASARFFNMDLSADLLHGFLLAREAGQHDLMTEH